MKKIYKSKRTNNKLVILDKYKTYTIDFVNDIYETSKAEEIALLDSILSNKGIKASFYLLENDVAPKKVEPKKETPVYEVEVNAEAPKEEVDIVEYDAATVQAAARVLCDKYNLAMREVNTIAKIEEKARELGCAFPKLRK